MLHQLINFSKMSRMKFKYEFDFKYVLVCVGLRWDFEGSNIKHVAISN